MESIPELLKSLRILSQVEVSFACAVHVTIAWPRENSELGVSP
jgi:hypothetical protein